MRPFRLLYVLLLIAVTTVHAEAPNMAGDQERDSATLISRYIAASKKSIVRGVTMMAHFVGNVPKLERSATLNARKHIGPDGIVEYDVTERQGDATIQKELIARFMGGEVETSSRDNSKVAINPENYKFKLKGMRTMDDREVYVFELNPRKSREGLFKGELWVDAQTMLTVRETGHFVKSPSVFLKKVVFSREYSIREGRAFPKLMQTSIETRFWGKAELDVQYSEFAWDAGQGTPAADN